MRLKIMSVFAFMVFGNMAFAESNLLGSSAVNVPWIDDRTHAGNALDGDIVWDTTASKLYMKSGASWVNLTPTAGNVAQGSAGLVSGAGQLLGTNTNDNASAGYVGQYLENFSTGQMSATTATYYDLASVTLTAGDWDVTGVLVAAADNSVSTFKVLTCLISTAANGSEGFDTGGYTQATNNGANAQTALPCATRRYSLSSSQTVHLVGYVEFSGGTINLSTRSFIRARRVR